MDDIYVIRVRYLRSCFAFIAYGSAKKLIDEIPINNHIAIMRNYHQNKIKLLHIAPVDKCVHRIRFEFLVVLRG
jgi:hypothetical protein